MCEPLLVLVIETPKALVVPPTLPIVTVLKPLPLVIVSVPPKPNWGGAHWIVLAPSPLAIVDVPVTFSEVQLAESVPTKSSPAPLVSEKVPVTTTAPLKSVLLPPAPFLIVTFPVTDVLSKSSSSAPSAFVILTAPT